jgi:hypothetical protein
MKKDPFDVNHFEHELNGWEFGGRAEIVLDCLSSGDWSKCGVQEINQAFDTLYIRHDKFCSMSEAGLEDKRCVQIRKCIHILARIWARMWLTRDETVFLEKKEYYRRRARLERANAHDEVMYSALLSVFRTEFGRSSPMSEN